MKKSVKKALIILAIILAVLFAISSGLSMLNSPKDRSDTTYTNVTIEEGSSTEDIAKALQKAGVIDSVRNFRILSKLWRYDGKYKAGTYALSPSMRSSDIAKTIINGSENTNTVTIPEGYTIEQTAEALDKAGVADKDKFMDAAENGDFSSFSFLDDAQTGKNHLEGYLFPDTYQFGVNASEKQIITTMLNQFDNVFTEKYKKRAKKLGYTENEIVIIASMIERETQVDSDRAKVASVIYNRLDANMPLQLDCTVQYALGKQKESLTYKDTQVDSPYNTYTNTGLPKGPICSPGKESIEAALYPAKTDYLYYVLSSKLDGSHKFSSTYSQFEKDKAAYSKALKKQNKEDSQESDN
jgi:UPF0755 protein